MLNGVSTVRLVQGDDIICCNVECSLVAEL